MANVKTSSDAWLHAGLVALAAGGPGAVRIEVLASELGVTKGGFYWHFANRAAFIDAMLDHWEQTVVTDVITAVGDPGGDPREQLRRLFDLAFAMSSTVDGLAAELAIRDWARRDAAVSARIGRVDERRMDFLRDRFGGFCADPVEVEARCLQVMSLLVGSYFVALDHGRMNREVVVRRVLDRLLE